MNLPASVRENKKARKELLQMREGAEKLSVRIAVDVDKNKGLIPQVNDLGKQNLSRVCEVLKENGWLTRDAIQEDGARALAFLIANNRYYQAQRELLPVLLAAAKKGFVNRVLIANLIDSIRVAQGMTQIFGTQATVRDKAIYLYPLANETRVEEWRKAYGLSTLAEALRDMEVGYGFPALKMLSPPGDVQAKSAKGDIAALGISDGEKETVKVETELVSLNIRVLTRDLKPTVNLDLSRENFSILEDGVEQQIAFFSMTEKPIDLVLILDFSGSAVERRGLIKKAARRFVQHVRPQDRIAVIAFANDIQVISDLDDDRSILDEKIRNIEMTGSSPIWDTLNFAYRNIIDKESSGRRTAVVFMTDGVDNSPRITFADLIDVVRQHDTTIFPVNIGKRSNWNESEARWLRTARLSLTMLADESGGQLYDADDIKDLDGAYDQVINDVGKVYSLGYEPKNYTKGGKWRSLTVNIVKSQADLIAKTRRGYYAK